MRSLEEDYKAGKVSPKKYKFYMAKYNDRLRYLDKNAATNRIRSMQGKPAPDTQRRRKKYKKAADKRRKEENDLVQKYIIDPKKGDKNLNAKKKKEMKSGTYKLLIVLILVIAFTIGISAGIFVFDFQEMSVVNSNALVEDTAFPDLGNVTVDTNETSNYTAITTTTPDEDTYTSDDSDYSTGDDYSGDSSGGSYAPSQSPSQSQTPSTPQTGSETGG